MITDALTPPVWDHLPRRAFISHGVAIGVRTNESTLLDRVPVSFPPGWEETSPSGVESWYSLVRAPAARGSRALYQLYEGDTKLDEGFRLTRLLDGMDSAIRLQVGRRSPERLFVHAGAVGWKGTAIVIPGPSGAGKTSLVAALVTAGATYYSDEYAVLDGHGMLHPFTRALSVRQGEHRRLKRCAVVDLGGRQATEPLPVGFVLDTKYRPDAHWTPRVLSSGHGAMALFANTLAARERPSFAFSILAGVVSAAVSLAGDRGDAPAAAAAILDYADRFHHTTRGIRS